MDTDLSEQVLNILKCRFSDNMDRHAGMEWASVEQKILSRANKLQTLSEMERTGGVPDVIGWDQKTNSFVFCDCSPESPTGRRGLCYDRAALDARKENKPKGNAIELASAMGVELLTEQDYRNLQALGEFDLKTSSWIATPENIRTLGGALFCDRRFGQVFLYHNGAESYYAARGFRALVRV
jgi:Protein of unknown function (DUF4256)